MQLESSSNTSLRSALRLLGRVVEPSGLSNFLAALKCTVKTVSVHRAY